MKTTLVSICTKSTALILSAGYALSVSQSVWSYNSYDWLPASSCTGGGGMEDVFYGGSFHNVLRIVDGSLQDIPGTNASGYVGGVRCPIPRIYPRRPEYLESVSLDFVSGPGPSSDLPRERTVHARVNQLNYRLTPRGASPGKTLNNLNGIGTITFSRSDMPRGGNWGDYLDILVTGEGNYLIGYRIYWNLPQ
jgi:hypothetical protein